MEESIKHTTIKIQIVTLSALIMFVIYSTINIINDRNIIKADIEYLKKTDAEYEDTQNKLSEQLAILLESRHKSELILMQIKTKLETLTGEKLNIKNRS